MIVNRVKTTNNKELVLINLHMSAYDKGGEFRQKQLNMLEEVLQDEYKKGNYVIAGGDWNHVIPTTDINKLRKLRKDLIGIITFQKTLVQKVTDLRSMKMYQLTELLEFLMIKM